MLFTAVLIVASTNCASIGVDSFADAAHASHPVKSSETRAIMLLVSYDSGSKRIFQAHR